MTRKPPTIALGDTVVYLPTGWHYTVIGIVARTYCLEPLGDAPNVWPWVTADKLHLPGSPTPPRTRKESR